MIFGVILRLKYIERTEKLKFIFNHISEAASMESVSAEDVIGIVYLMSCVCLITSIIDYTIINIIGILVYLYLYESVR